MARLRRLGMWLAGLALLLAAVWLAVRDPDMSPGDLRAKYANAESEFVTVAPNLTVHIRDEGPADAPVLFLLHGSNASLHTWEPWVARLKDRYRIISMDHPGHGLTGPHPQDDYTAPAFVAVVDAIARNRGIDRFVLAGNSMGGWIAWEYALAHPEKLRGLVLVDAAGAPLPETAADAKLPIGFRIARTPGVNRLMESITPRSLVEKSIRQTVSVQSIVTPQAIDRYWELLRYPGNRRATGIRFAGYAQRDAANPPLENIATPTLIIWGSEDKLITVAAAAVFDARIPASTSVIYDNIGHIPMEETPDRSAADVAKFIEDLPKE